MLCPQCTANCSPESSFCPKCGYRLEAVEEFLCPSCLTPLPDRARFCLSCGAPVVRRSPQDVSSSKEVATQPETKATHSRSLHRLLPAQYVEKVLASRGSIDGERRVVTILFSDVKGSTALAEHLDPEDVLQIMNGAFEVLIEPITRYEGTLARLMGDAIMAFFGAPIAHEDDPVRACHAALDIVEGIRKYAAVLERERGVKGFNVRVGLNTGLVVVAEVGSDLRVEYTAMGDAVNLAARMEAAAEPGTVLLTEATLRHLGHAFDTEPVGPLQIKGKSEPVSTYRLLRPRVTRSDESHFRGISCPLVGRSQELQSVQRSLTALEKGAGGIICISGDIGMGKSRLVQEARAENSTFAWAETWSYSYTEGMSYRTLGQLLKGLPGERAEFSGGDSGAGTHEPSSGEPSGPAPTSYLSMILGGPEKPREPASAGSAYPEEILPHVIHELYALLRTEAGKRPLVLIWDDLQWIDPSSLSVLESILPLADEVPILFILLFRIAGDRMRLLSKRISDAFPERNLSISLERLDHAHSANLLERLLAGRNVARDIQEKIIERTDGNPLFLKEIAHQLVQPGKSAPDAAALMRSDDGTFSLPDTLRGVIMSRIDGLPPHARQILQTAAVLGRTFQPKLLTEILPEGMTNQEIVQSLDELVRREFIQMQSPPSSKGEQPETYAFTHNYTLEVAHESLLLTQRKELHGRAARAIQTSASSEESARLAEILSVHYEIAGDNEQAFQNLMEAGERAKSSYAHLEAINYYRRALKLAAEMGIAGAMLRNLYEGLGDVYVMAAKYPAAMEHYRRALELPQNVRRRAALLRKKGLVHEKSGLYEDAVLSFKDALTTLENTIDLTESAQVYGALGRVYFLQGNYQTSVELSTLAKEIMEKRGEAGGIAHECNLLGLAYTRLEEPEKAMEHFQRALSIFEERKDSIGLSVTYNNLGQLYHHRGDYKEAVANFSRSIELCKETGNRHGLASAYDNMGQALALDGKPEEGTVYLAKAVAILSDIGSESEELVPELWLRGGLV